MKDDFDKWEQRAKENSEKIMGNPKRTIEEIRDAIKKTKMKKSIKIKSTYPLLNVWVVLYTVFTHLCFGLIFYISTKNICEWVFN